jgi:hypothetical protein
MAVGAVGDRIQIGLAVADGTIEAKYMLGVTAETIADGQEGYVSVFGALMGLDTSAYTVGTILYIDPDTPGEFTTTEPLAPAIDLSIAIVTSQNSSSGRIFVRMWNQGGRLQELQDILLDEPANDDLLVFEDGLWVNKSGTEAGLVLDSDARLSDARTPTAHASTHESTGSDAITIAQSQVTNLGTDLGNKLTNPLTTEGDLIVQGSSVAGRLAIGAADTVLTSNGTTATWAVSAKEALKMYSGEYYRSPGTSLVDAQVLAINTLYLTPLVVVETIALDRIAVRNTASGPGTYRLGIYSSNSSGVPSSLVVDAGTVSLGSGTPVTVAITISETLSPGTYWLGATAGSTTPRVLGMTEGYYSNLPLTATLTNGYHFTQTSVSSGSALPATLSSPTPQTLARVPIVFVRLA